jgi:hypothetical protein
MLELLPAEILDNICNNLDIITIFHLSLTSKEIRNKTNIKRIQRKISKVTSHPLSVKYPLISDNSSREDYQILEIKGFGPALKSGFIKVFNRKPSMSDIAKLYDMATNKAEITLKNNNVIIVHSKKPDVIRKTLWRIYYYIRDKLLAKPKYSNLYDAFREIFPKKRKITSVVDLSFRLFSLLQYIERKVYN